MGKKDVITASSYKNLVSVNQNTEGKSASLMRFYLEENAHRIEISFSSTNPTHNLQA